VQLYVVPPDELEALELLLLELLEAAVLLLLLLELLASVDDALPPPTPGLPPAPGPLPPEPLPMLPEHRSPHELARHAENATSGWLVLQ
jgi:hypothetical protein